MKNAKPIICFTIITIVAVVVWTSRGSVSQEPGSAKISTFMRLKLEPMKGALEGIALADFEKIAKNAGTMRNLLLDEGWMIVQTPAYRQHTEEFRKAVELLRDSANNKNLDGATLGYVQMTLQCVQCHQTLRKHQP